MGTMVLLVRIESRRVEKRTKSTLVSDPWPVSNIGEAVDFHRTRVNTGAAKRGPGDTSFALPVSH